MKFFKMRANYSLMTLVVFVTIASIAVCFWTDWFFHDRQREKAMEWASRVGRSRGEVFPILIDSYKFGLSNYKVEKTESGWGVRTVEILEFGFFAFPPGKVVDSVDEAFSLFEEEIEKLKHQNQASPNVP